MKVSATVSHTGEVLEYKADKPEEVIDSLLQVNEYLEAYERIKANLKSKASLFVEANGPIEHSGYILRSTSVQRYQYDKSVLRDVLDSDTYDLFMEPAKGRIDRFLAENLEQLGEGSTRLRKSMIPVGKAYPIVRLEKLS